MQKLQAALRSGQHVIVRDEPWLVVHTEGFPGVTLMTLRGTGSENAGETARALAPFDTVYAARSRMRLRRGTRREALAAAAMAIGDAPCWRESWTAASAKIDIRPWQLAPALDAVGGATRLLLADAVGLGKTIQALLIVSELLARGVARRILVLTPASLRDQWADEATRRFGLVPTVFDHAALMAAAMSLPAGVNPWSAASFIISSIDLVKRGDVRASLDAAPFDILIVDEAHHLTPATDRGAVVAGLAARTPWVVLLTATPHTGDDAAFRFLQAIGAVEGDGGLRIHRRQPADVLPLGLPRRHRLVVVSTTAAERALLDETLAYARAVWSHTDKGSGAALVASVIARRAASCASAARRTLERRLALLASDTVPDPQPPLPWDEGDRDDDADDEALRAPGLADRRREIDWLHRLARLAEAASLDSSKIDIVRRLLRRTREPLIIFSEYRDVAGVVAARIADLATVAVLHGGLSIPERRLQLATFANGAARVLVTTDAAGEGLNLQGRCRLVVNLELPWNPLRLEQRIGRVDRLGQQRRVHAIQLLHRGSFEEVVQERFDERRARAAAVEARGDRSIGGDTPARNRRLRAIGHGANTPPTHAICADAQPGGARTAAVLVFATDVIDGRRQLVDRCVTALRFDLRPGTIEGRPVADVVARLTRDERTHALLIEQATNAVHGARLTLTETAIAWERRATGVLEAIASGNGARLVQASLFDRREEQRSHLRADAVSAWTRNVERHLASARALRHVSAAGPRLVAAWIE